MFRPLLAACTMMTIFAAAPAAAQTGPFYVAVPATAPTRPMLMTQETVWTLRDIGYTAARSPERAAILCELVARGTGPLSSFSAGGRAFDADALARCNARAR